MFLHPSDSCIQGLAKKQFDLNTPLNKRGETALHIACGLGSHKICKTLLNTIEADPWRVDFRGQTPLHTLSQKGFAPDIIDLLIAKVSDIPAYVTHISTLGLTAMDMASLSLMKPNESDEVIGQKLVYVMKLGKHAGTFELPAMELHFAAQKLNL
jgi:ankyrin repeat protein